jgi:hypothetical protein
MLLRDLDQLRLAESLLVPPDNGAVCLEGDPVLLAVRNDLALLTPWVQLDLVDCGNGLGELFEVFDSAVDGLSDTKLDRS